MEEATRLYDLRVETATNSDPSAFSESELKMAVEEVLRKRNLKAGEYAHVPESQYTQEEFERALEYGADIVPYKYDLALDAIPEVEDVDDAEKRGKKLTFQQLVYVDAWKAVQQLPTIRKSWTMREAWRQYVSDSAIDVSKGDGRKKQQRFERVLKYTGDFIVSNETEDEVLDRIQSFIYGKRQDNPTIKA